MRTLTDPGLQARLESVHARGRVIDVLLGVALDVLEPFASDYLSADEYVRLCKLLQGSINAAADTALTTMAAELALIPEAELDLNRRLERARVGRL